MGSFVPWMAMSDRPLYGFCHGKKVVTLRLQTSLSAAWSASAAHVHTASCKDRILLEDSKDDSFTALLDSVKGDSLKSFPKQIYFRDPSRLQSYAKSNSIQCLCQESSAQIKDPSIPVSPSFYSGVLQQCGHSGSLSDGKIIHDQIIRHGYEENIFVSNCLGYMYGHCGALPEACAVFFDMDCPDVFSWNFLIRAHALHGQVTEAFDFFFRMQISGIFPDKFSFISILSACDNVVEGMLLHASIIEHEVERDVLVGNAVINFYGKCGSIEDAQQNFDLMSRRDLISWNSVIAVYAQHGEANMAFVLFNKMKQVNVYPDRITFITLLSASANDAALFEGQYTHSLLLASEYMSDVSVGNALINMYGKCGLLADSWSIFRMMPTKDIISWNAIVTAYAYNKDGKQALQLYSLLHLEGLVANKVSLVAVLDACACEGTLTEGKRIHSFAINVGLLTDVVVMTAIVHMYSKCRSLLDAQRAFEHLVNRTLLTWNTIIAAHSQGQEGSKSLSLLSRMLCEGVLPNHVTIVGVISACANQETLFAGKCVHAFVLASNLWEDVGIGTTLVHMYGKHGVLKEAEKLFDRLPTINLVTWNTLIAAYAQHELLNRVEELCSLMYMQGTLPDKVTFLSTISACTQPKDLVIGKQTHTRIEGSMCKADGSVASALVSMYGKCNALKDAQWVFEGIQPRSLSCWNALVGAYSQNGWGLVSLELFHRMQWEGFMADKVTFLSILGACTLELTERDILRLHTYVVGNNIAPDIALGSAFINAYGKLGKLKDALQMFSTGPKHEVDTWNALITAYAQSGYAHESLQLYFDMQQEGLVPNEVTYVSLLSGCSHAGLLAEGCFCFRSCIEKKTIAPKAEHYNCMVDLFGRAGRLEEAEYMVNKMSFDPTITSLLILLAACKYQTDVQRAERVTYVALSVDTDDPTPYIMLMNIYLTQGESDEVD